MPCNQRINITNIYRTILSALLVCVAFPVFAQGDVRTVETNSYTDVLKLFNEIGYTTTQWEAGIREVPRIELTHILRRIFSFASQARAFFWRMKKLPQNANNF